MLLVSRHIQATAELKARDSLIIKYKKVLLKAQQPNNEGDAQSGGRSSSSQTAHEAKQQKMETAKQREAVSSSAAPSHRTQQSTAAVSGAAGAEGVGAASVGSRQTAAPAGVHHVTNVQIPLKKQLYNTPPYHKHHSTSTLEVLQRSATAKAAMKQHQQKS